MNAPSRPADLPEIIGGRYRVLGEIGRGGMGRVLKVEHLHTGEVLAMKILLAQRFRSPDALERFRREARTLAQVRGEHVVRVIDADIAPELGETPYIVTELLHGEDLNRYLKRRGRLDASEVSHLLNQLALGLARVHRARLVHRDLKPGNIFLDRQEDRVVLKLLDFGLVKPAAAGDEDEELTREGQVLGTPLFMSPEQVHGQVESVTAASDIWAVGMIAYSLLTGRNYWDLRQSPRGIFEIGAAPLQPPSLRSEAREAGLTGAFDAWFLRSCALNPASRWPDAITQWRELAAALGSSAPGGLPYTPVLPEDAETVRMDPPISGSAAAGSARQRRQVTVLFYRIVHGAEPGRIQQMDPEEFEDRENSLHALLDEALGDLRLSSTYLAQGGRFVFFGYPVAYGHDARRAVDAALRLVEMARSLDAQVGVGVHTGLVLTGSSQTAGPSQSTGSEVAGPALGIATGLEHSAKPGEVLVSEATWELLGGRFRGERTSSGNYIVLGAREDAQAGSRMFGRDAELALLLSCLEQARTGESQTVLISGEVGIGKSRLVKALREDPGAGGIEWLECACSPYFQRTPFRPLVDLSRELSRELKTETLDQESRAFLDALQTGAGVISGIERLSPALRRERTIHALIAALHARAQGAPLALVVEDLHWADPSTLEFLDRLSALRHASLLTVLTARQDFAPSWSSPATITPLQLRRLPQAQAAQLIAQIANEDLAEPVAQMLVKTTEGIPLFIEELTRLVTQHSAETTGTDAASGSLPTTLSEALNARLDRLGPARVLAEQAAVIGPEFTLEDLRILAGDDPGLDARVRELVRGKIFQPRGLPPQESYAFQHALLRDAAYGSLPKETRRDWHARLAAALAQRKTREPEILARHFAEGGMPVAAAGWCLQAGQAALERSANAEAREHFDRGIGLLEKGVPEKHRATEAEQDAVATLQTTLWTMKGMAWVVSRGYAVPEAAEAFTAAMEQVRRLKREETPELAPALWANWVYALVRGRFAEAEQQSQRLMRLAGRCGNAGVTMLAHLALGISLHGMGRFDEALEHLEQGLALYDPAAHGAYRFLYGQDPWMLGSVFRAWVLSCVGFPDRALDAVNQAVEHAQKLRHPNSIGFALALSAMVHQYRGEAAEVARAAQALLDLSLQQGWIQWLGHARLWGGAAQVMQGQIEPGLAAMREGRAFAQQAGERSGATHYDTVVIEGLCSAGLLDEASEWIARAKQGMQEMGEYAFESGLLRSEGEVAGLRGDKESARRLFLAARESAASRRALSYQQRAERSLARLEQEAG